MTKKDLQEAAGDFIDELISLIFKDLKNNNSEYKKIKAELKLLDDEVEDFYLKLSAEERKKIDTLEDKRNLARSFEETALLTFDKSQIIKLLGG